MSRPGSARDGAAVLPGAVIAGFPKCGTTSVYDWLARHPAVCASSVKETHFLSDADNDDYRVPLPPSSYHRAGLDGYARYFAHRAPGQLLVEATPAYVFQRTALEVLAGLAGQPLIVFVVRRPSERIHSLYRYATHHAAVLDKRLTFACFVEMLRRDDPLLRDRPILRNALRHTRYADYLETWVDRCGRDRIHVEVMEHLQRDPRETMMRLVQRLGLDPRFYADLALVRSNPTRRVRAQWLHRLLRGAGRSWLAEGALRRRARAAYYRLNFARGAAGQSVEDRATLAALDAEFVAPNRRLATGFDLDLAAWS